MKRKLQQTTLHFILFMHLCDRIRQKVYGFVKQPFFKCTVGLLLIQLGSGCGPGSDCSIGCDDSEYRFYVRLVDSPSVFKSIRYNTLDGVDTPFSAKAELRLVFAPTTTQVIFETTSGWDTLVYQTSLSNPQYYSRTSIVGDKGSPGVNMELPVILSHTFDSTYYSEEVLYSLGPNANVVNVFLNLKE
jgi:hypothetical protein